MGRIGRDGTGVVLLRGLKEKEEMGEKGGNIAYVG